MASRSTRNKIKWQGDRAKEYLKDAQDRMTAIAAMADDRSTYINDNVPVFVASLDEIIKAWDKFCEGL